MILFTTVLGTVAASFLMCLVDRRSTRTSLKGRSLCMACQTALAPWDILPILSYILLRGKCRTCQAPIPAAYPLGEAFLGLNFGLAYTLSPTWPILAWHSLFACLLFYIAYVDMKVRVVEDQALALLMAATLAHSLIGLGPTWNTRLLGTLILGFSLWLIWRIHPQGLGFGDVLFAGLMGMVLGPLWGARAFLIGVLLALLVALYLLLKKNATAKTAIPLLPFLGMGTWAILMVQLLNF